MANELNIALDPNTRSGLSVEARLYLAGAQVGSDIALTESGSTAFYSGDVAAGTAAGIYAVGFYNATTGDQLGAGTLAWNGTTEAMPATTSDGSPIAKAAELAKFADGTSKVTLAETQASYAPAKAGDAMTLTSGERNSIAAAVWAALTSGLSTAGSIGKLIVDNLNAAVGSVTPATIWAYSSRTLTGGTAVAVSPIDSSDNISIYRATDYASAIGTTLSWSKSGYPAATWETDATGSFRYRLVGSATTVEAGTVALTHDGDETLTATLTLTDTETALITGAGRYELIVTTDGGLIRAFAYGNLSITDKVPDPE